MCFHGQILLSTKWNSELICFWFSSLFVVNLNCKQSFLHQELRFTDSISFCLCFPIMILRVLFFHLFSSFSLSWSWRIRWEIECRFQVFTRWNCECSNYGVFNFGICRELSCIQCAFISPAILEELLWVCATFVGMEGWSGSDLQSCAPGVD